MLNNKSVDRSLVRLIKCLLRCVDVLPSEPHVLLLLFADEISCLSMEVRQKVLLGVVSYLYQASGRKLIKSVQNLAARTG